LFLKGSHLKQLNCKQKRFPGDNRFNLGAPIEEIHENFPTVPISTIRALIVFARKHQPVP
jgi:hypothetical protein